MKEYCKKFSEEPDDSQEKNLQDERERAIHQRPANEDLRFVVRESFNLGLRFITELEKMLRKLDD